MDNTRTVLSPNQLEWFHDYLNSIEPLTDFTYELEEGGMLPFLDLCIKHHLDGTLYHSVQEKDPH